jgi:hypothetical protein
VNDVKDANDRPKLAFYKRLRKKGLTNEESAKLWQKKLEDEKAKPAEEAKQG